MTIVDEPPVEMMSEDLGLRDETTTDPLVEDVYSNMIIHTESDGTSCEFKVQVYSVDLGKLIRTEDLVHTDQCTISLGGFPGERLADIVLSTFDSMMFSSNGFSIEIFKNHINRLSYSAEIGGKYSLILDAGGVQIAKSFAGK